MTHPPPYWIQSLTTLGRDKIIIHAYYHKNAAARTLVHTKGGVMREESCLFGIWIESGSGVVLMDQRGYKTFREVDRVLKALSRIVKKLEV